MSSRRRRREDRYEPRHRAVAFNDSRDKARELVPFRWGVPYDWTRTETVRPPTRFSVHRFPGRAEGTDLVRWGLGARSAQASFDPVRAVHQLLGASPVVRVGPSPRPLQAFRGFNVLRFPAPGKVLACVRRRMRREVMFAKQIAGRRGLGTGGVRRTADSAWSC